MGDVIAAVRVGEKRLAALGDPFHRPADAARRPQRDDLLGVDEDFRAEAAAHVGRDHAQLVLGGHADEGGDDESRNVRVLAGVPQGEMAGAGVVFRDRRARLDGVRHQAIVDDVELGDVLGRLERRLDRLRVAQRPLIDRVLGRDLVNLRRAPLLSLARIGDRGQHVIIDLHLLGCVLGLRQSLGDHHRDRIAHVACLAVGERRMRRHLHGRAVLGMDHPAADQIADLVGGKLGAGEHGEHARPRRRRFGVDPLDARVSVRRAQKIRMGLARAADIVGVVAFSRDEALILFAPYRGADTGRAHDWPPVTVDLATR